MRQLLHEDDHTAAEHVANDIVSRWKANGVEPRASTDRRRLRHSTSANVSSTARDHTPEDYAAYAIQDPLFEAEHSGRIQTVAKLFGDCTRVLDIACGTAPGDRDGAGELNAARRGHRLRRGEHRTRADRGRDGRCGRSQVLHLRAGLGHRRRCVDAGALPRCCRPRRHFDGLFVGSSWNTSPTAPG